jgi:hypothetical protein
MLPNALPMDKDQKPNINYEAGDDKGNGHAKDPM